MEIEFKSVAKLMLHPNPSMLSFTHYAVFLQETRGKMNLGLLVPPVEKVFQKII